MAMWGDSCVVTRVRPAGARGVGRRFRPGARGAGRKSAPPCAPANPAKHPSASAGGYGAQQPAWLCGLKMQEKRRSHLNEQAAVNCPISGPYKGHVITKFEIISIKKHEWRFCMGSLEPMVATAKAGTMQSPSHRGLPKSKSPWTWSQSGT